MFNLIHRFTKFLMSILWEVALETAQKELEERNANTTDRADRLDKRYERMTRRQATMNVGKAVREAEEARGHFHDVIMVAFDLQGRDAHDVHTWLQDNMPEAETFHGDKDEVFLDSWWVANDERYDRSDTDSAVFVTKGKQAEARELLRKHGLVG